ncbi:MAG: ATP-binding protein [Clostridiales Family XIII bacterium]|jgi:serine/threonine-protein kinase RsbW|nr:ATP-binding protein [Clostridiales Family XIII bacterium]
MKGNKMADVLKFMIPGKPEYVRTVRLAISSLAGSAGFDIEAVEDIMMAVSEACSNLVCHGVGARDASYEVSCEMLGDRIVIRIENSPDCCEENARAERRPVSFREGGIGLNIIKALMDEVDVLPVAGRGTRIEMIKYVGV